MRSSSEVLTASHTRNWDGYCVSCLTSNSHIKAPCDLGGKLGGAVVPVIVTCSWKAIPCSLILQLYLGDSNFVVIDENSDPR